MPARVESIALVGLGAQPVTVEVDIGAGLPSFTIVGLPDKAVDEARERVRAAIKNSGFQFPTHRITVNLAPADLPKVGPAYDLPIALGILAASKIIPPEALRDRAFVGELSLAGEVRSIAGILPMALHQKHHQAITTIIPQDNLDEAELVDGLTLVGAKNLRTLVDELVKNSLKPHISVAPTLQQETSSEVLADFAAVHGLDQVKRALEIAAAGNHNILLVGPPGTGKTLLARAFASILPELSPDEHLEVLTIRSAAGLLRKEEITRRFRPVRSPHHTASPVALVGGGTKLRPGEASLAHRGVLFLDELPEFPRHVLEALREPLEEGVITIARAKGAVNFPARFTLVAAANPCPCGYYGDPEKACQCSPGELVRYQRRLSGPLLDRIDLVVSVPRQPTKTLLSEAKAQTSDEIRQRVIHARAKQAARMTVSSNARTNSELSAKEIKKCIKLTRAAEDLLITAGDQLHLSGRVLHRLLKVGQTIADLAESEYVDTAHLAEALQYRQVAMLRGE